MLVYYDVDKCLKTTIVVTNKLNKCAKINNTSSGITEALKNEL